MDGMHKFDAICNIGDCAYNNDTGVCELGLFQQSQNCLNKMHVITRDFDKSQELHFDSQNFIKLQLGTTSKGSQEKWQSIDNSYFLKGRFFYQNRYWNDDLVEVIASTIATQLHFDCVEQKLATIDHKDCSASRIFTEKFYSYAKIDRCSDFEEYFGTDRVKFVIDNIYNFCKVDTTQYLAEICVLDFLIGNEDRHENNFGVFWDGLYFKKAKIFDNGLGLFEHDTLYFGKTLEESIPLMSKRFFGDLRKSSDYFASRVQFPSKIDLCGLWIPSKLALDYLKASCSYYGMEVLYNEDRVVNWDNNVL